MRAGKKYNRVIGIDPDIYLSGVAEIELATQDVKLQSLRFPELIGYICDITDRYEDVLIVVELDRETTHNWHFNYKASLSKVNKMGFDVGKCIQRGTDIADMLRYLGCEVEEQKPLRKCWAGKDGKITDEEVRRLLGINITKTRTNQEERDALLIAITWTNIPLIMKPCRI